jgi:hypothetical protein
MLDAEHRAFTQPDQRGVILFEILIDPRCEGPV